VHLGIIKVFYLPTDAQENSILNSATHIQHKGPNNIFSHTTELTTLMYFN